MTEDNETPSPQERLMRRIAELERALKFCADNIEGCIMENDIPSTAILANARSVLSESEGGNRMMRVADMFSDKDCVCKREICTYDLDFGCGLDHSKDKPNG